MCRTHDKLPVTVASKKQNNTRDDGLLYQDFGRRQRRKGKLREGKIEKKKEELRRESTKKKNKRNEDITL